MDMAIIDCRGKITIGEAVGKELGFTPGERIAFVMVNDKLYRLADPEDILRGEKKVVCEDAIIDEKFRFSIPSSIRKMYTREANIVKDGDGLYLQFIRLQSDEEWLRQNLLASMTDDRK